MRNIKFPSRLYFKRYKINPNDLPMTPTRIFSFVCTVSIFILNDVVVTGALVNVRCPMKVDRGGRLVVNPWTTVQHKTIIIVTIVERLQVKYILLFLLYILLIYYTPMWIFATNLPTNMEVAELPVCQINVARWGLPLFDVSPPPPQHDMVTTDNDVSSGRYGVNLNQDSIGVMWRVGSFWYLTGTRWSRFRIIRSKFGSTEHTTTVECNTYFVAPLPVDHHHISVQLGSIERIKGIQFISDGK